MDLLNDAGSGNPDHKKLDSVDQLNDPRTLANVLQNLSDDTEKAKATPQSLGKLLKSFHLDNIDPTNMTPQDVKLVIHTALDKNAHDTQP